MFRLYSYLIMFDHHRNAQNPFSLHQYIHTHIYVHFGDISMAFFSIRFNEAVSLTWYWYQNRWIVRGVSSGTNIAYYLARKAVEAGKLLDPVRWWHKSSCFLSSLEALPHILRINRQSYTSMINDCLKTWCVLYFFKFIFLLKIIIFYLFWWF